MGNEILASSPVPINLEDVCSEIFPLMREDREFFGLIDQNGTTLQALYLEDDDLCWFEIPRPDLQGAYGRHLDHDTAAALLEEISGPFPLEGYDGFKFENWQSLN